MYRRTTITIAIAAVMLLTGAGAQADDSLEFDFLGSTPVGAWQEREQTTTRGGKEVVTVMRIKYLGDEERDGETYAWIENEMASFKVKKDRRKPQGDPVYVKFLVSKSVLEGDVVNAIGAFNDLAVEVIMQTGDQQPMRIKGAGSAMSGLAQSIGFQVDYELTRDGSETVTVPAGTFECERYRGQGSATAKVLVKTINVESRSNQWVSEEVPFGVVRVVSDDTINGKPQQSEARLTAYGRSGASSRITGEPQDLDMSPLEGLFGG
jgi:hypothetical protein